MNDEKEQGDLKNNDDVVLEPEDNGSSDEPEYTEENISDTVKKLKEKIKILEKEKQDYLNNWQKDKADFINIRKRDEEEKKDFMKFARQGMIEEILPVLDSFDMAMGNKQSWENVSKEWRLGIEGILNQFLGILTKNNVVVFGATGDYFDPNLHHSIGMVKTENKDDDHKIAEVLQRGYKLGERVIRPALVKVFEI